METFFGVIAKTADIAGIVSLVISIITLFITKGIKESMVAHVEKNLYREQVDKQIHELEAFRELLVENDEEIFKEAFHNRVLVKLDNIKIAYEAILTSNVIKRINSLKKKVKSFQSKLMHKQNGKTVPYAYITDLVYVIAKLKEQKEIL